MQTSVDPQYPAAGDGCRVELEPPAAAGGGVDANDGDFDSDDEDAMLQRALLLSQQVEEVQWKFPTEIFFMTLRALHTGLLVRHYPTGI